MRELSMARLIDALAHREVEAEVRWMSVPRLLAGPVRIGDMRTTLIGPCTADADGARPALPYDFWTHRYGLWSAQGWWSADTPPRPITRTIDTAADYIAAVVAQHVAELDAMEAELDRYDRSST